jgi:hypothetical protein
MTALRRLAAAAASGFVLLAAADALLLLYAWPSFALTEPGALEGEWPTFSRALTVGNAELYAALAAIAGAGLLVAASALAVMRIAERHWILAGCGAFAAALGVVHYFHVTITLTGNLGRHMALSYLFFFGMSGVIIVDVLLAIRLGLASRAQRTTGIGVLAISAAFLATYALKDVGANPWPVATQRVFVMTEWLWIILAHAYAFLYVRPVRSHFRTSRAPACEPASALR